MNMKLYVCMYIAMAMSHIIRFICSISKTRTQDSGPILWPLTLTSLILTCASWSMVLFPLVNEFRVVEVTIGNEAHYTPALVVPGDAMSPPVLGTLLAICLSEILCGSPSADASQKVCDRASLFRQNCFVIESCDAIIASPSDSESSEVTLALSDALEEFGAPHARLDIPDLGLRGLYRSLHASDEHPPCSHCGIPFVMKGCVYEWASSNQNNGILIERIHPGCVLERLRCHRSIQPWIESTRWSRRPITIGSFLHCSGRSPAGLLACPPNYEPN